MNEVYSLLNTDAPNAAPMNVIIPPDDITNESFVVQWDAVDDFFPITYIVRWYRGDDEIGMASVTGPRHTVTGLTANTSYNVTVVAVNTCCGEGPVSDVVMTTSNNEPPTLPPSTPPPTPTNPTSSSSPPITTPPGNFVFSLCCSSS